MSRVAVVFALAREATAFRCTFRARKRVAAAPCRAEWCDEQVLVLETGVGPEAVARALRWLLAQAPVGLIVSAGFSGALSPNLRVGELVWAEEVVELDGSAWPTSACARAGPWHCGRALMVAELVGTPEEKGRLGKLHGAVAADMESGVVVRLCREAGVLVGVLRAISDDGGSSLSPALLGLLRAGRVAPSRVLAALLRRPRLLGELLRLARDTRVAGRRLAEGLVALLACRAAAGSRALSKAP